MVYLYSRPNGKHVKLQTCRSMHHVLVRVRHEPMLGIKHDFTKYKSGVYWHIMFNSYK